MAKMNDNELTRQLDALQSEITRLKNETFQKLPEKSDGGPVRKQGIYNANRTLEEGASNIGQRIESIQNVLNRVALPAQEKKEVQEKLDYMRLSFNYMPIQLYLDVDPGKKKSEAMQTISQFKMNLGFELGKMEILAGSIRADMDMIASKKTITIEPVKPRSDFFTAPGATKALTPVQMLIEYERKNAAAAASPAKKKQEKITN